MGMTKAAIAERDGRALELRRAGVPVPRIVEQLRFGSTHAATASIARGMAAQPVLADPTEIRKLELDRLDRLQQGVWAKAVKGDVNAIDRVLRLSEMRMKLAGVPSDQRHMQDAYDQTVTALNLPAIDAAAVAAGRRVAQQIDAATATGDGLATTKALYLLPHLMNVLEKLGATPAGRVALDTVARESVTSGPQNDLLKFKASRGIA